MDIRLCYQIEMVYSRPNLGGSGKYGWLERAGGSGSFEANFCFIFSFRLCLGPPGSSYDPLNKEEKNLSLVYK